METPDTSIRRAPRTYGRRRDHDASLVDAVYHAESSASSHSSPAISESGNDIPPSSDFETSFMNADDGDDAPDDDVVDLPTKFKFGWKKRLEAFDDQFDDDMENVPPRRSHGTDDEEGVAEGRSRLTHGLSAGDDLSADDENAPPPRTHLRLSIQDELARIDHEFDENLGTGPHKGAALPLSRAEDPDDPFGGPLPVHTGDSHSTEYTHSKVKNTSTFPFSSSQGRQVKRRKPVAHGSDSELAATHHSSPQTSPGELHPITTPNHSSSPTPPTTQEMAQRKGKEKARGQTPTDEELPALDTSKTQGRVKGKRKEKETRVKAPTRKERVETQKAVARIRADQQVVLQREDKRLPVTGFWEKFKPKTNIAQESADPPSEGSLSDPIQSFSSPIAPERPPTLFVPKPSTLRPPPAARSRSRTADPLEMFAPTNLLGGAAFSSKPIASSSKQRAPRTPSPTGDMFVSTGLLGDVSHGATGAEDSSDDEGDLPDVSSLLEQEKRKREAEQQRQRITEMKQRFVKNRQQIELDDDSDLEVVDNDMHVVAEEEAKERLAAKARHIRPSVGRKNQLTLAGRSVVYSPTKGTPLRRKRDDFEVLQAAAIPAFSAEARAESRKGKERATSRVNPKELNKLLLRASEKQSKEIIQQKEREFYKREGGLQPTVDEAVLQAAVDRKIQEMIRKGQLIAQKQEQDDDDGDDEAQDEESDGDWTPDVAQESAMDQVTEDDADENEAPETSQDENEPIEEISLRRRAQRRNPMLVDSDDENENLPSTSGGATGRVLVADSSLVLGSQNPLGLHHRGSISSIDERLEDGTDKENDMRLMFDRGEDKENTVVAGSPFSPRALGGPSSLLPLSGPSTSLPIASQDTAGERTPLRELHKDDEDDVFLSSPTRPTFSRTGSARLGTPGTVKRRALFSEHTSPLRGSPRGESQGFAAFFKSSAPADKGKGRATDSGEPCTLQPAADIDSGSEGFAEYFQPTMKNSSIAPTARGDGFSQIFSPGKGSGGFSAIEKKDASLNLSLGSELQPSLHVDEDLVKKADDIFEHEQEAVVAHAVAEQNAQKAASMYVNEHGFLTQTRPPSGLPSWAMGSPTSPLFVSSPAQALLKSVAKSSGKPRQPLGTLALAIEDDGDSDDGRLRRLKKRASTPELDGSQDQTPYRTSVSPSPVKRRNAFDVLGRKEKLKAPKFTKKLQKSAFIEGEAEESDEDAGFGFGLVKKKDDEEESDEEQDKMLEGLVDDAAMDEDTLAEEKVMEKVKEHQALDDALDEKVARDAAEGKLRIKRRNRLLDFEDDESDEEDEDARRRRQRMAKKRRIEGDTLEQLARNPETEAFVKAYQAEIDDDHEEFAHLGQEETDLGFIGRVPGVDEEEEEEEDDENAPPETVPAMALQEQLRRVARGEETVKTIDTNDVNWVFRDEDEDMDDENVRIKEIAMPSNSSLRGARPNQMEWEVMQQPRREDSIQDMARQQKWARSEGGSRNTGTGRASAVTGHKSTKAGGGSIMGRREMQAHGPKKTAKLAKAPSALSAVSDRRARFA